MMWLRKRREEGGEEISVCDVLFICAQFCKTNEQLGKVRKEGAKERENKKEEGVMEVDGVFCKSKEGKSDGRLRAKQLTRVRYQATALFSLLLLLLCLLYAWPAAGAPPYSFACFSCLELLQLFLWILLSASTQVPFSLFCFSATPLG